MSGERSGADQVRRFESVISRLLRIGVTTSLLLIAAGTVLTLISATSTRAATRSLSVLRHGGMKLPLGTVPHTASSLLAGLGHLQGPALTTFGMLLLIATPVARVAVSAFLFAATQDRRFVIITLVVLAILLGSFVFGSITPV
jgi:uncharacterized membrane protein